MCCAGCDELKKSMKNAKNPLCLVISLVWNLNIRFNMMWLSVLHRYGTGCIFTTNKNIIMSSFKSSRDIQKKEGGPDNCFG